MSDVAGGAEGFPSIGGPGAVIHALFDQSPFSTVLFDSSGSIVRANAAFERLFRVTLRDIPASYSVLTDPELDRGGHLPLVRRAFAGDVSVLPLVRYDASGVLDSGVGVTWTQGHFFPVRDPDGRVTGVVLVHVDLTDRVRAEEAEHAANDRLRAIVAEMEAQAEQLQEQAAELEGQQLELEQQADELRLANDGLHDANARLIEATAAARSAQHGAEQSAAFVRGVLESIADPFVVYDRDWRFQYANDAARAVFAGGIKPSEKVEGAVLWERYPDVVGTTFEREMRRSSQQRIPVTFVEYLPGTGLWTEVRCYPMPDGALAVLWRDITQLRQAEEARHFLASSAEVLSRSLDRDATARALAELLVPRLADWCAIDLIDGDGTLRQTAVAHVNPAKVAWARELNAKFPPDPEGRTGAHEVVRTREPLLIPEITDEMLAAAARSDAHLAMLREVGFASALIVPLIARDRVVGAMSLVSDESARRYGEADLRLALEIGGRAALALDNALAYAELRVARDDAETERSRAVGILESMADAHFTLDRDFRFMSVNSAMERNVGVPRDSLLGRTIWEAFPSSAGTVFERSYRRVVEERVEVHFTGEYRADGLDIVPDVDAYPTADGGVAVFWRDIAPKLRAESALAESERQFRTLADAIPTLAWTARADGFIDWYNARWYEYTGTTPAQMEGWGWQSVHDPRWLPEIVERWTRSIESGEPFEMTFPLRGANGQFRRFLTRVMPVLDGAGRVLRWFGTNTDVEAERAAREAAERALGRTALLQSLTDALSEALTREDVAAVVTDGIPAALGAHLGVLALVTGEGDQLAVAAAGQLPHDSWREWATFPVAAPVPLAQAVRENRPVVIPTVEAIEAEAPAIAELGRANGTRALYAIPVSANGGEQLLGAIGLSFPDPRPADADEVRLLETIARQVAQALERARLLEVAEQQRAAAESANAAKSQFLSTMSHELRTPLNAIAGYTQLLALGVRGELSEKQALDMERISRANQHMTALVTDLLNFARLDARELEFHLVAVDLAPVAADIEPMVAPQMDAKGITFDRSGWVADPGALVVRADPEKLQQILLNLLTNAVKFTEPGGRVRLACAREASRSTVRISVSDTGRGIPADQLERIFEPFVQVDRHRTQESQQGVGLGLSISRDLARGMAGELQVRSSSGEGSTFTLELPLA